LLPHESPPWGTVHYYYRSFRLDGTWQRIHDTLREQVRRKADKKPTPSAAIIDAQSVKTDAPQKWGAHGSDAGKKIVGRKRHLIVDTFGLILAVVVHAASVQDRDGGTLVLERMGRRLHRLKIIWADGGYAGRFVTRAKHTFGRVIDIVKRPEVRGSIVLPKRWIVKRTFGWLGRYRRLSKDYETLPVSSETMIQIAIINVMLHRLDAG